MALWKSIPTSYGIDADYHKITATDVDWLNKTIRINLDTYVTQAIRNSGKAPIMTHSYYWSGDEFSFTNNSNLVAECYTKLKTLEQWSNAQDV